MLEDTATTEEDQSTEDVEIEDTSVPIHPYDTVSYTHLTLPTSAIV